MGRTRTAESPPAKPSRKATTHPLFPAVDGNTISTLWLYRVVKHHRNTLNKLLVGPLDPASMTNEAHLKAYGPGHLRLVARGADGSLRGSPYELLIGDQDGHVPMTLDEARAQDEGVGNGEAAAYKRILNEQNEQMRALMSEERQQRKADFESFAGIVDKVVQVALATREPAAQSQGSEPPAWMRKDLTELRTALATTQKQLADTERELFKLKVRREGNGEGDSSLETMKFFMNFGEKLFEEMGRRGAPPPPPSAAPSTPSAPASIPANEHTTRVIDGETVPALHVLAQVIDEHGSASAIISPEGIAVFRRLHAKGTLPPAYAALLRDVLQPAG